MICCSASNVHSFDYLFMVYIVPPTIPVCLSRIEPSKSEGTQGHTDEFWRWASPTPLGFSWTLNVAKYCADDLRDNTRAASC